MNFFTAFCGLLILGGAIIIGLSILQTRLIFQQLESQLYRSSWQILTVLMATFVLGYLLAFLLLLNPNLPQLLLLLSTVFGLGSIFVFLTVYVSRLTINHLYQLKETLKYESLHDPLTGLANRKLFYERLEQCLARYQRKQNSSEPNRFFSVLMLDLDKFKLINDTFGHQAGDQVLVEVASRLQSCLRSYDILSRLGGDEFCIILEELKDKTQLLKIVERIQEGFTDYFDLNQRQIQVNCSIGISTKISPHSTAETILEQADLALYQAKSQEKQRYSFFAED